MSFRSADAHPHASPPQHGVSDGMSDAAGARHSRLTVQEELGSTRKVRKWHGHGEFHQGCTQMLEVLAGGGVADQGLSPSTHPLVTLPHGFYVSHTEAHHTTTRIMHTSSPIPEKEKKENRHRNSLGSGQTWCWNGFRSQNFALKLGLLQALCM